MPQVEYATKEEIQELKNIVKEILKKIESLEDFNLRKYSYKKLIEEGEDAEELFEI